ncbi:MAG: hypothetical protein LBM93_13465 [Oscillospiraceae bacterium]|jgi:hypothetical protein|nr:hypothetical protein [Oscillospiraceae bacterium]
MTMSGAQETFEALSHFYIINVTHRIGGFVPNEYFNNFYEAIYEIIKIYNRK